MALFTIQDDDNLTIKEPDHLKDPQEIKPQHSILHLVPQRPINLSPLKLSYNSNLNSLFGFSPMEEARTIQEGTWDTSYFMDISTISIRESTSRFFLNYKVTLTEHKFTFRYGIEDGWEGIVSINGGELFETSGDAVLVRDGKAVIKAGSRGTGLGDLALGVKKSILNVGSDGHLAAIALIKVPISFDKNDLITSVGVDTNYMLAFTQNMNNLTVHANLGILVPGEADVFDQPVNLTTPLFAGISALLKISDDIIFVGQAQANQSVFSTKKDSVEILEGMTGTVTGGLRFRLGSYMIEAALGSGFNKESTKMLFAIGFQFRF